VVEYGFAIAIMNIRISNSIYYKIEKEKQK